MRVTAKPYRASGRFRLSVEEELRREVLPCLVSLGIRDEQILSLSARPDPRFILLPRRVEVGIILLGQIRDSLMGVDVTRSSVMLPGVESVFLQPIEPDRCISVVGSKRAAHLPFRVDFSQ